VCLTICTLLVVNASGFVNSYTKAVRPITVTTIYGKIIEVDRSNKLVKLEGLQGKKITLKVENPYNLKATKVGGPMVTRFYRGRNDSKVKASGTGPIAS